MSASAPPSTVTRVLIESPVWGSGKYFIWGLKGSPLLLAIGLENVKIVLFSFLALEPSPASESLGGRSGLISTDMVFVGFLLSRSQRAGQRVAGTRDVLVPWKNARQLPVVRHSTEIKC